jgi:hypothetical protein
MTDFATASGTPGRRLPPPTFFDPTFERLPASVAFDEAHPGPVLLLFDPASDREWVADAAVAIATAWNAGGRRTVMADLSLEDPVLHERIGMGNMDGVVDIFLYGASLARSARPVPGRGFYLITAGTYTPEPEAIFRHPRWEKLVAGFRDAQASLLLFAPADAPGIGAMRAWAGEAIFLGERADESRFDAALAEGFDARAWLTPPVRDGAAAAAPPASPAERFPEPEPVMPWNAPRREPEPAAVRPPIVVDEPETAALPVPDPEWEELPPTRGKRRGIPKERKVSPLALVLLVILLMALVGVVMWQFFPDILQGRQSTAPVRRAAPASAPAAAARPTRAATLAGTPRPFAVFVKAYSSHEPAEEMAAQVAAKVPGEPVYVIAEETSGVLYHKVYAGMMGDTVEAARLRARLVEDGTVNPDDVGGPSALVQPRPLAFDLGDFASAEAARSRAAVLAEVDVSAYPVAVPMSDGTERWKLYGGAFADSASARPMARLLEAKNLPARLVPRTGRPPASPK